MKRRAIFTYKLYLILGIDGKNMHIICFSEVKQFCNNEEIEVYIIVNNFQLSVYRKQW